MIIKIIVAFIIAFSISACHQQENQIFFKKEKYIEQSCESCEEDKVILKNIIKKPQSEAPKKIKEIIYNSDCDSCSFPVTIREGE